jgi:hypothetical protein
MIVCPSCYHQTISEFLSNRFPYVGEAALDFHDRNCVDCKRFSLIDFAWKINL